MISLNNIQVTFNPGTVLENRALRGVSLTIPENEFVTIIGSNGYLRVVNHRRKLGAGLSAR